MINNPIIFYTASALIIVFVLISMFAKNIINSLLAAIVVFFSVAILFYILGSEYNAIIQIAIYGLAVPVIIGLSIMFTTNCREKSKKGFLLPYLTFLAFAFFVLIFVRIIMISLAMVPETFHITGIPQTNSYDVMSAFARGIYIDYVWAFELLSLLLTIIIAGFTLFKVRRNK